MVVLYLVTIGGYSRSHNVQVRIVCIVVGIDEPGLSGFGITHFLEILVRKIEQLGFRHFVTLARDGYMKLRFLDSGIHGGIFHEKLGQFFGSRLAYLTECSEVFHLQ